MTKYRKQQRGRMKGQAHRGNFVAYGDYGLQALEPCWIKSNQIEAARIAINRYIKRGGKVWIKIFPDKPVSKKPAQVRMGSGKAANEYWCAVVRPGRVLFEISGVTEEQAREAMRVVVNINHTPDIPCLRQERQAGEFESGQLRFVVKDFH